MLSSLDELIKRGSATAKAGFSNEHDVVDKFNAWQTDKDAQKWLQIMGYRLEEIEKVAAIKVKGSHKADIQVKIKTTSKDILAVENISAKLVSNPQGFNQIDKRWVDKYAELWAMPKNIVKILKLFTGETTPNLKNTRDPRRFFIDELPVRDQQELVKFITDNKMMIVADILKGKGELAVSWMLIYQKNISTWSLLPINAVMNFYGKGNVRITSQGSLKIGEVTMQRKGGDGGRKTARMLQFKINPCKIVNSE